MFTSIARLLVHYRFPVITLVAAVTVVAAVALPGLRFDFTPQAVYAGADDLVEASEEIVREFASEDSSIVVLLEARGEHDVLHRDALAWQMEIAAQLAQVQHVDHVRALPTTKLPRLRLLGPPWVVSAPLVHRLPMDENTEARVRSVVAAYKPLREGLLSADGRIIAIVATLDPAVSDIVTVDQVVEATSACLDMHPPPEGYRTLLTGLPVLRVEIVDSLWAEQHMLVPIAGGVFLVILAFLFRRLSGTLLPLLAVGVGMIWVFGLFSATGQSLNIISNVLPVLLLIVGTANAVHVISRYAYESRHAHGNRAAATSQTLAHIGGPCMLAFLTTGIGFLSLVLARSQVLAELGVQAAIAMCLLYVSIMTVLGSLLPYFAPPHAPDASSEKKHTMSWLLSHLGHALARRPQRVLGVALGLILFAIWFVQYVVINSYNLEVFDRDHPSAVAVQLVEDRLAGLQRIEIGLTAQSPGRFLEPETYRKVAEIERFAAEQDDVLLVRSYVDVYQEVYARFRRRDPQRHELPPLGDAGQARIDDMQKLIGRMGDAVDMKSFLSPEADRARLMLRVRDRGTRETLRMVDQLGARMGELFPSGDNVDFAFAGDAVLMARAIERFVHDLVYSLLSAAVVIFILVAILFRSIRVGLIAVLPNLTPLTLTLGYMGLRGLDLNMSSAITFVISLGVAVDGTIHFLSRFLQEMRHHDVAEAIQRTLQGTGLAIMVAVILIIGGCSVLQLSSFVPTRTFAELTSVTMAGALLGDLLLLPALLVLFWKPSRERALLDSATSELNVGICEPEAQASE